MIRTTSCFRTTLRISPRVSRDRKFISRSSSYWIHTVRGKCISTSWGHPAFLGVAMSAKFASEIRYSIHQTLDPSFSCLSPRLVPGATTDVCSIGRPILSPMAAMSSGQRPLGHHTPPLTLLDTVLQIITKWIPSLCSTWIKDIYLPKNELVIVWIPNSRFMVACPSPEYHLTLEALDGGLLEVARVVRSLRLRPPQMVDLFHNCLPQPFRVALIWGFDSNFIQKTKTWKRSHFPMPALGRHETSISTGVPARKIKLQAKFGKLSHVAHLAVPI